MNKFDFHLDFLDEVVKTLASLASTHDDLSHVIAQRARNAQGYGATSRVTDPLKQASSILASHREPLQSQSTNLNERLLIARSTLNGWSGTEDELRTAMALVWAPIAGLFVAHKANGATVPAAKKVTTAKAVATAAASAAATAATAKKAADITSAIFVAAGSKDWWIQYAEGPYADGLAHPDCAHFIHQIMASSKLMAPVGTIYDWHSWDKAGYSVSAAWGSSADKGMVLPANVGTIPQHGSFIELGTQTTGDGGAHHAAYYLGQKGATVYVAESNWPIGEPKTATSPGAMGYPGGVRAYTLVTDAKGNVSMQVKEIAAAAVPTQWDPDNQTVLDTMKFHYKTFDTAYFYAPPAK
jgi:hypothetical protein